MTGPDSARRAVRPSRRRSLVLIPQHFGCLVYDRRTSRYCPFDTGSTSLLEQLSKSPIGSVLGAEPDAQRREQARRFFEHFYRLGFFTVDGLLAADMLDLAPPAGHLAGPLAVHLEITTDCNLCCRHCFARSPSRRGRSMPVEEMDRLFGELAAIGCFRLGLTGGEPLLHPGLLEIIDAAHARGLHPCLTTNGLLINRQLARELGRREPLRLNVSLDGATAETNDAVRGAGTFHRVLDRLAALRRHAPFSLAFTLTSANVNQVEACATLARQVGAEAAVFRPLYPVGRAGERPEWMPGYSQYAAALQTLAGSAARDSRLCVTEPFGPLSPQPGEGRVFLGSGCGAGNTVASISVDGDVSPCSFLGPKFHSGNLRQSAFAGIWHSAPQFVRFRIPQENPAGSHVAHAGFPGGCRARALALSGAVDAPDPWLVACAASRDVTVCPSVNLEVVRDD